MEIALFSKRWGVCVCGYNSRSFISRMLLVSVVLFLVDFVCICCDVKTTRPMRIYIGGFVWGSSLSITHQQDHGWLDSCREAEFGKYYEFMGHKAES